MKKAKLSVDLVVKAARPAIGISQLCLITTCESFGWSQTAWASSVEGALFWVRGDNLFSWFLVRFPWDINLASNDDTLFCQAAALTLVLRDYGF